MKKIGYKFLLIAVITVIIISIVVLWYINNVYPYNYSKEFYQENTEKLNCIVDYFESLDNIYSAQMNEKGEVQVTSSKGLKYLDCSSDASYTSFSYLRKNYVKDTDEKSDYILNFINAQYDNNGNMNLEIPVYAHILNTKGDVNAPNRLVYYLVYSDDNYSGSANSNYVKENIINNNWFVISKSHTLG